jgi:hypothetical protein
VTKASQKYARVGPNGKIAPPGCFWSGHILYAGVKVGGKRHRISLKTDDPEVAAGRHKAIRAKLLKQEFNTIYPPVEQR